MTIDPALPSTAPRDMLSRYAECSMWLARYMERIENLARIIDITETFVKSGTTDGWRSIVQINADEERFFKVHDEPTAERVIAFYVIDHDNPTSIASLALAARENARSLRPLISTEMWTQLNVFTQFLRDLREPDIRPSVISRLCARIKQDCQTHLGITEGTFYRDQAWLFYQAGRHLERADQITRLIDIKYHTLLPSGAGVGSPVDVGQWMSVLRSAAGYHAYRRLLASDVRPASIVGFLLKSQAFPRSLATNLRLLYGALTRLRTDHGLRAASSLVETVEDIRAGLDDQTVQEIILRGLHEFLDWTQSRLQVVQEEVAGAFWPSPHVSPKVESSQTQSQS